MRTDLYLPTFIALALATGACGEKTTRTHDQGSPAQPGELPGKGAKPEPPAPGGDPTKQQGANDPHMVGAGQPGSNDKPNATTVGLDEPPPGDADAATKTAPR